MPELPEMETYKKLLMNKIAGKTIGSVQVNREKSINVAADQFIREITQQSVMSIERRAKHLLFHLNSGNVLLLHLMLNGWMYYGTEATKPKRNTQIELVFGEEKLYFIELRLGYLHLYTAADIEEKLAYLGPEPMAPQFTESAFIELFSTKRGILKTTLVDQHFISGIGNCYSDEICFYAGLLPARKINELTDQEKSRLYHSMRSALAEAIQYGGYMEHPLYEGDTLTGQYNDRCKVYDAEGQPCARCGQPIIKQEMNSRKTFFCNNCQS